MIEGNTEIGNLYKQIRVLEARYRKDLDSHLFFPLADAYVKADMLDQAEVVLREGLSKLPKYCAAKALLGEILFKKGDLQEAQQQLEGVVEMVPDNVMAHKLLIEVYKEIGLQDSYEKELKILKLIDQREIHDSDIEQVETQVAETHIQTTKHIEEIEIFKAEDQVEMPKNEKLIDLKTEDKMQSITKDEAIQGKEIILDETRHQQSEFIEKSREEEENKKEIITATLAELYFSQGFLEKSIDIYKKLLVQQPDQKKWAERLIEIQEIQKNIEVLSDDAVRPEAEDKKEKILATLERWLENCQKLKKSNI